MLKDASFINADCEGASFAGAELRGANFTNASLLATSFSPDARLDRSTRISDAQIEMLLPNEANYVSEMIGRDDSAG